ncbi:MAG: sigma-54 dependent transcriptional regulator [bacterium]|nr:sigma-54 dependent transcriptional regulator [bacterium]
MSSAATERDSSNAETTGIRVLLVDNDPDHAHIMAESLESVGYETEVATSGPAGAEAIENKAFDVVVTDLVMNDVDGMQILTLAKERYNCEVIMITGHASIPKAVEAIQVGAFNFLEKPIRPERLRAATARAAEQVRLRRQNELLIQRLDERFGFDQIVHASNKMTEVIERLKRIAVTDATVMITGPTGVGKDLVAQAIHQNSPRKKKPFVALNCGAVAPHLVESELFGHVRGAFTDAHSDRVGKFEYANGGTLFLDEVGDMPMATQIKLLRVLEDREITRVGDNKSVPVNVRVISATNVDLSKAIEAGDFRRDLLYRLEVVTVDLPPLCERKEDIFPLVDFFRRQFAKDHRKEIKSVAPAVMRRLAGYDWPGNVRELRNVIDNMVVLDVDDVLDIDDLPPKLTRTPIEEETTSFDGLPALVGKPLDEIERWAIEQTLNLTGGNREEAANILQIGTRTLYRKLKKYEEEE